MFNEYEKEVLVVVCKDEMFLNLFRKMAHAKKDNPIDIVAWDEETWLDNKKTGGYENTHILFIGDNIKGVDRLLPVIDFKFDYWGIKYGWAGKRAIILANSEHLYEKPYYKNFLEQFKKMCKVNEIKNKDTKEDIIEWGVNIGGGAALGIAFGATLGFVGIPIAVLSGLGIGTVASLHQDKQQNKKKVLEQQYFYGISRFFCEDLDDFMNV